jgi:ABC-type lipoprotein release transport system permease subunit
MIAPGIIDAKRSGARFITINYTTAGFEMIVSGTGVQKVAVHLKEPTLARALIRELKTNRGLTQFTWKERDKMPET